MSVNISQIVTDKDRILRERINPNVTQNRFDLFFDHYDLYDLGEGVVPVFDAENELKCGLFLTNFSDDVLSEFYVFLFKKYPKANFFWVESNINPIRLKKKSRPYWHIDLPATKEEFDKNLSSSIRKTTRQYPRRIRENIGEFEIKKYSVSEMTQEMVQQFLDWKHDKYYFKWNKPVLDFLKYNGVTDGFVMIIDGKFQAMQLISDTGDNVRFVNCSYNPEYRKFGLGTFIYYSVICEMIKAGKKKLFLGGYWFDYKKQYNGILTMVYSGFIFRNTLTKIVRLVPDYWEKICTVIDALTSRKKLIQLFRQYLPEHHFLSKNKNSHDSKHTLHF